MRRERIIDALGDRRHCRLVKDIRSTSENLRERCGIKNRVFKEFNLVNHVRNVFLFPGTQIIYHTYARAVRDQRIDKMRANESGTASHHYNLVFKCIHIQIVQHLGATCGKDNAYRLEQDEEVENK
jgi:hypothetical protein